MCCYASGSPRSSSTVRVPTEGFCKAPLGMRYLLILLASCAGCAGTVYPTPYYDITGAPYPTEAVSPQCQQPSLRWCDDPTYVGDPLRCLPTSTR